MSVTIGRRKFIVTLGGATLARPPAARAQQNARRIGVLMTLPEGSPQGHAWIAAFKDGLQKVGWSEGRNIQIDIRWGAVDAESQRYAREIIATQPDLFLRKTHRPRSRCCNRHAPSPSFLPTSPIRSAAASLRACRSPAATSPDLSTSRAR